MENYVFSLCLFFVLHRGIMFVEDNDSGFDPSYISPVMTFFYRSLK